AQPRAEPVEQQRAEHRPGRGRGPDGDDVERAGAGPEARQRQDHLGRDRRNDVLEQDEQPHTRCSEPVDDREHPLRHASRVPEVSGSDTDRRGDGAHHAAAEAPATGAPGPRDAPGRAGTSSFVNARTLGVEEEFLLVDPDTGRPRAVGQAVLAASADRELAGELQQEQVETATKPCHTLDELSAQIRAARSAAAAAAADAGAALVPLGTSPLAVEPTITPSRRYAEMARRFGLTVAEGLTCGCHVRVAGDSPDEGVAVLDRIRPWLAPLLALSVNSPFWNGEDSGYRSFRTQVWQRWPVAGPYARFGSAAAYREFVDTALATDT